MHVHIILYHDHIILPISISVSMQNIVCSGIDNTLIYNIYYDNYRIAN